MNKNLFVILLILPFFYACEDEPLDPNDDVQSSYIEIDDPVVGQENIYLAYERPNDPNNGPGQLTYTGDTTWLSISNQSGNVFEVQAKYSQDAELDIYLFTLINDSLIIEAGQSNTGPYRFFDLASLPMTLSLKELSSPELDLSYETLAQNCVGDPCSGSTVNHEQLNQNYDRLNIYADYTVMVVDGPGHHLLYSQEYGLIRVAAVSAWTKSESGWNFIKQN
ncbi:MAG: hypothetical protein AAFR87_01585 [Bacteroidota bacterium]